MSEIIRNRYEFVILFDVENEIIAEPVIECLGAVILFAVIPLDHTWWFTVDCCTFCFNSFEQIKCVLTECILCCHAYDNPVKIRFVSLLIDLPAVNVPEIVVYFGDQGISVRCSGLKGPWKCIEDDHHQISVFQGNEIYDVSVCYV